MDAGDVVAAGDGAGIGEGDVDGTQVFEDVVVGEGQVLEVENLGLGQMRLYVGCDFLGDGIILVIDDEGDLAACDTVQADDGGVLVGMALLLPIFAQTARAKQSQFFIV